MGLKNLSLIAVGQLWIPAASMTIFILLLGPEMIRFVSNTFHEALALLLRRSPLLTSLSLSLAICLFPARRAIG